MSSNIVSDNYQGDAKLNALSGALVDKTLVPLNARYRSKSLSSDKLNQTNADRAAILEDVEAHYVTERSETPGCLVRNKIMNQGAQTINGTQCSIVGQLLAAFQLWDVPVFVKFRTVEMNEDNPLVLITLSSPRRAATLLWWRGLRVLMTSKAMPDRVSQTGKARSEGPDEEQHKEGLTV
ncbi:unnamed protein product, partial [Iphiclides podalirius]